MYRFFHKNKKAIFIGLAVLIAFSSFVGLGSYMLASGDRSSAVAEVAGQKIPYSEFQMRLEQAQQRLHMDTGDVSDDALKHLQQEVLQEMVVETLLAQKATEMGLRVTDLEVAAQIRNDPSFQVDGHFDQRTYFETIMSRYGMTPRRYEAVVRDSLLSFKLRQFVYMAAKVTPAEVVKAYQAKYGTLKDFEKKKAEFANDLQQERGFSLLNYYLRLLSPHVEFRSYLDERLKGQS